MTAALYDDPEIAASLAVVHDFRPRVVTTPNDAIPRPARGAACIRVEHTRPGSVDTDTVYADDRPEHRNPATWRARLGPGTLRLVSHPAGVDDANGYRSCVGLGTWAHDDEVPDVVRFDAAPRKATVTVSGMVADAVLTSCPDGVPHYAVADVCPLARMVREARRNQAASGSRNVRTP